MVSWPGLWGGPSEQMTWAAVRVLYNIMTHPLARLFIYSQFQQDLKRLDEDKA